MSFTAVAAIQCWAVLEADKNYQLDSGVIMNILLGIWLPSHDFNYHMISTVAFKMINWMATFISHEFMHALGFDHEQKRGDQAQNVYIHYGWFQFFYWNTLFMCYIFCLGFI